MCMHIIYICRHTYHGRYALSCELNNPEKESKVKSCSIVLGVTIHMSLDQAAAAWPRSSACSPSAMSQGLEVCNPGSHDK